MNTMETNEELIITKEIISTGLLKAAESLSFFMKEEIRFEDMDYSFNKPSTPADFTSKNGNNIHLLITEVIGDLKGICCLMFNEEEADKLRQTALPPEITANPALMAEMSDGILLEVDNIISASVITMFSNILKRKMYGGVPQIRKLNSEQVNEFIKEKLETDMFIISFNTHFISSYIDFSPQFLWLLDKSFAEIIKMYAEERNQIKS